MHACTQLLFSTAPWYVVVFKAFCLSFRSLLSRLGVKLAPYFDGPHFDQAAAILNAQPTGRLRYVVTMNTLGNCMLIDTATETSVIAPNGGRGGLAGGFVKPVALAQVRSLELTLFVMALNGVLHSRRWRSSGRGWTRASMWWGWGA